MFGKGSLIFVAGFGILFSIYQLNLTKIALRATDNFNYHYTDALVHEASTSSMNLAINMVWAENEDSTAFRIIAPPCTTEVVIYPAGADTVVLKVVSRSRIYNDEYYVEHNVNIELRDSIFAFFTYDKAISEYAVFCGHENGLEWITGDTAWGPLHVNHIFTTHGSPVFYGKITSRIGISPNPAKPGNQAKFYGGWEIGIDVPIPDDLSNLVNVAIDANNGAPVNTICLYDTDISLEFLSNGDVIRTIDVNPPDTVALTDIAPADIIYSTGDIRVSGVLNGRVALYSSNDIWIDDDIVYAVNPIVDPESDDFLTLIADHDIIITDNIPNNNDVTIHACVFASESFSAENYISRPVSGVITSVGSIAQGLRGRICKSNNNLITHGFSKSYYHDPRFTDIKPPHVPSVGELQLVSWWE